MGREQPATSDTDERRKSQRVPLSDDIAILLVVEGRPVHALLSDVSKDGLCLVPEESIPKGANVVIDLPADGKLEGRCVWAHKAAVGIEFGLAESKLERVLKCLHLLLQDDE